MTARPAKPVVRRAGALTYLVLAPALLVACALRSPDPGPPLAVMAAEVDTAGASLWAKAGGSATVRFQLTGPGVDRTVEVPATAAGDFTAQVRFDGLEADRQYRYQATDLARGRTVHGRFRTAPPAAIRASVRFAFGGDVAGQNVCRDEQLDMPIFAAITATEPDFLIGLGDMIYADTPCHAVGWYGNRQVPATVEVATTRSQFQQRWSYVRDDRHLRSLLTAMGYYGVWDDHEVVNDFAPSTAGDLLNPARQAFLDYTPVHTAPARLYRRFRWGRHLEVFVLDTRSLRDPNAAADGAGKSMLGPVQRDWLVAGLVGSDATWKVVVSSVPIAIPTGWPPEGPRDGWASGDGPGGYESELRGILLALAREQVGNMVWLTTDVHHATGFSYLPFAELPGFTFHEFVSGPLNAGIFPSRQLDLTFNPHRLFYHAPATIETVDGFQAALGWFNFGLVEIDANGRFDLRIIDANGREVAREVLVPR